MKYQGEFVDVALYETKDFMNALRAMKLSGGRKSKAADQVLAMLGSISRFEDPFQALRLTKHGETRIPGCVKYDLQDFCRLVTVVGNGCIFLLYAGDHNDADAWIKKHQGLTLGAVAGSFLGTTKISDEKSGVSINNEPDNWSGVLVDRLSDDLSEQLLGHLPFREVKPVRELLAGSPEGLIKSKLAHLADESLRTALFDILVLLNNGALEEAQNRVLHHLGMFKPLFELSPDELVELDMGDCTRKVEIGSVDYNNWAQRFIETKHPFEWFLFMHPEQEKLVLADYSGPAKLSGVTGSGKTSIAIKRAVRLASEYQDGKILILSLNRALCEFISEIVDFACGEDAALRERIEVNSLFSICQRLLVEFEPMSARLYSDVTWRLEEHKDEVYREFYRCLNNVNDAEVLRPIHRLLTSQSIEAERYIAEEFDWIRSAVGRDKRADYNSIARQGRGYKISEQHRPAILDGLTGWERKMSAVGVIDYMGLVTALTKYAEAIEPQYRSIIVDEAQDFGSVELSILRRLVKPDKNDIFLCGDAAQHILPKHQSFESAGIDVKGRSNVIRRNYRNSREILRLAHKVLTSNLSEFHFEIGEMDISDPELSYRSSSEPLILEAPSLQIEIAAALRLLDYNDELAARRGGNHSGCIALVGYSSYEVQQYGKEIGIPVLDGASQFRHGSRFLSDLEQTKGYEFDTVVIVNCAKGNLPPSWAPEQEVFRSASEFYVAMTRAKTQLILSYSGTICDWLSALGVAASKWSDVVVLDDLPDLSLPGFLQEFPDLDVLDVRELTGVEFIYTPYARGLEVDVQQKLEELVDGRGLLQAGTQRRLKWKTMGSLGEDLAIGGGSTFGPVTRELIKTRLLQASLGARPTIKPRRPQLAAALPISVMAVDSKPAQHSAATARTGSLEVLGLPARDMALLHSLNIRSLRELISVSDKVLAPHLSKKRIAALKDYARTQARSRANDEVTLSEIGFSGRVVDVLCGIGVKKLSDFGRISRSDLYAQSSLGSIDVQRILRVCREEGVALRDS